MSCKFGIAETMFILFILTVSCSMRNGSTIQTNESNITDTISIERQRLLNTFKYFWKYDSCGELGIREDIFKILPGEILYGSSKVEILDILGNPFYTNSDSSLMYFILGCGSSKFCCDAELQQRFKNKEYIPIMYGDYREIFKVQFSEYNKVELISIMMP